MNRLRIVIEESGPDAYEVKYVGSDLVKAEAALREPSANKRALFNRPAPTQFNRQVIAPKAKPAEVKSEVKTESPKSQKSK